MTAAAFFAGLAFLVGQSLGHLIGAWAVSRQCATDARIATDTRAAFLDDAAEQGIDDEPAEVRL